MKTKRIDITKNIKNRGKIAALSGRDLGIKQRHTLFIDDAINSDAEIVFYIPSNIYSVSSSFFLGMFGDVVRHFGTREGFLKRVRFECSESVNSNIDEGIRDALNNIDALI